MYVHVCLCGGDACECRCPQRPEALALLRAKVTGGCELPDMDGHWEPNAGHFQGQYNSPEPPLQSLLHNGHHLQSIVNSDPSIATTEVQKTVTND